MPLFFIWCGYTCRPTSGIGSGYQCISHEDRNTQCSQAQNITRENDPVLETTKAVLLKRTFDMNLHLFGGDEQCVHDGL